MYHPQQGMCPTHPSSMLPPYHANYQTMSNYAGQPSSGYQWTPASYQGQVPSGGYSGPPSAPMYPGQPPGRLPGGMMNNDGFQPQPINSMQSPYQQFNNNIPGGSLSFCLSLFTVHKSKAFLSHMGL